MMKFLGKAYRYRDKVISVCPTVDKKLFMVGSIKPTGNGLMSVSEPERFTYGMEA